MKKTKPNLFLTLGAASLIVASAPSILSRTKVTIDYDDDLPPTEPIVTDPPVYDPDIENPPVYEAEPSKTTFKMEFETKQKGYLSIEHKGVSYVSNLVVTSNDYSSVDLGNNAIVTLSGDGVILDVSFYLSNTEVQKGLIDFQNETVTLN